MITAKVAVDMLRDINDKDVSVDIKDIIFEKIESGEYVILTDKEYQGMMKAIANFQKKGKK